jgi:hypothetical protein
MAKYEVYVCDRCGAKEDKIDVKGRWGAAYFSNTLAVMIEGEDTYHMEVNMCPQCTKIMADVWTSGKNNVNS